MWTRRRVMRTAGAAALSLSAPVGVSRAADGWIDLTALPASAPLVGDYGPPTEIWAYGGEEGGDLGGGDSGGGVSPGPEIRVRQGERIRVRFHNRLPQPSTIHWHGIRIANAMDGVAGVTQAPVPPGESFDYDFVAPDAGTYWYHPHYRGWEQLARGLYGALIVEEATPGGAGVEVGVDGERTLILDDWRLDAQAQIDAESFGALHDWAHAGRLGNTLTVNSRLEPAYPVRRGERLRLRLINCANARVMRLRLDGARAWIAALDGAPLAEPRRLDGLLAVGPSQRTDLIVDIDGDAELYDVDRTGAYLAASFKAEGETPGGGAARSAPPAPLPANPIPSELDLESAQRRTIVMEGGARGVLAGATTANGYKDMRTLVREERKVWALNGFAGMPDWPLAEVARGRTVHLTLENRTAWPHVMHLHGHHFSILSRSGEAVAEEWRDGVLMDPRETVEIAFVADNPGDWLLHCHMSEHFAGGMGTWIRVRA